MKDCEALEDSCPWMSEKALKCHICGNADILKPVRKKLKQCYCAVFSTQVASVLSESRLEARVCTPLTVSAMVLHLVFTM